MALSVMPASAADVPRADVQAAVQTLRFLDSLKHHAAIAVDVVYRSGDEQSKALAQKAVAVFQSLSGSASTTILANAVALGDLGQRHADILYVVPGLSDSGAAVADFVRRQHAVSICNDPAWLHAQGCMLLIRGGARTEITLDTALAQDSGAVFSSFFLMMVKRK